MLQKSLTVLAFVWGGLFLPRSNCFNFPTCQVASKAVLEKSSFFALNAKKKKKSNEEMIGAGTKLDGKVKEFPAKGKVEGNDAAGPMVLYAKAGPDGESPGDCPFAHYVQLVLHHKGLQFELKPREPDNKPQWLVKHYEGKMPCLVHDGEAYTESSLIADYLEFFFPEPPLTVDTDVDAHVKANEKVSGLFPALARYIKNLDESQDPELWEELEKQLGVVDEVLKEAGEGGFLCGSQITLADLALIPKLYHAQVTIAEFKNKELPSQLGHLDSYIKRFSEMEAYQKSLYPADVVIWGWNNARGTA
mmetsp:Transcript_23255/g.33803  ORF Transcript_23255/g.33803 Transcript_23255/m.33803 type:complete len:305 (-) Transcript_23255:250-1164(-)